MDYGFFPEMEAEQASQTVVGQSRAWAVWVPRLYFCPWINGFCFLGFGSHLGDNAAVSCSRWVCFCHCLEGRKRWRGMMCRGDGGQGESRISPSHDSSAFRSSLCCGWGSRCNCFSPSSVPPSLSGIACGPFTGSGKVPACSALRGLAAWAGWMQ